jgi:hypothetical protein
VTDVERATAELIRGLRAAPSGVFQLVAREVKVLEAAIAKAKDEERKRLQCGLGWED